jgi:hypothetical protein
MNYWEYMQSWLFEMLCEIVIVDIVHKPKIGNVDFRYFNMLCTVVLYIVC